MDKSCDRIHQLASLMPSLPPGERQRALGDIDDILSQLEGERDEHRRRADLLDDERAEAAANSFHWRAERDHYRGWIVAMLADDYLWRDGQGEERLRDNVRMTLRGALDGPSGQEHRPFDDDGVTYCGWTGDDGTHGGCGEAWPCSTARRRSLLDASHDQGEDQ